MTTEVATRGPNPSQELVAQVRSEAFQAQVALALPEGMKPSRFVRVMATAVLENPELATKAEIQSVFQAGLRAAADGLLPDGREAAFVLFGNRCVYLPMVAGYRKIAADFGWSIRSQVVYAGDEFDYSLGMEPRIEHRPARIGTERGDPVGAYAVGKHKDGRIEIEVLTLADIEKVRAASRSANRGPWVDWWDRMAEKSAARRLFAKLPLGERDRARITSVLAADELAPGEAAAQLYGGPPGSPATDAPADREANGDQQGAGEVVDEAEQVSASSDTDGTPAPASAAEPEPIEEAEWKVPDGVDAENHPDVIAANEAAEVAFTSGKFSGKNLREVADDPKGPDYLSWVLKNWKTERFRAQVLDYCKVYLPELYEQATAEEEGPPV